MSAAPKKSSGSGMKILLILLGIAGVGALVCCGGIGTFVYKSMPNVTQVPSEVTANSKKILDTEIDEETWEPKLSLEMSIPWTMDMRMANFTSKKDEGGPGLTRMALKVKDQNQSQEDIDRQLEQSLSQGGGAQGQPMPPLAVEKGEEVKVTMLGQETTLLLSTGKRVGDNETEWKELKGHVRDGEDIIVIKLQLKSENFDLEAIKAMLEGAK